MKCDFRIETSGQVVNQSIVLFPEDEEERSFTEALRLANAKSMNTKCLGSENEFGDVYSFVHHGLIGLQRSKLLASSQS